MPRPATHFGWLMGSLLLLGTPALALGQGNIFNPYGNSGYADYREFGSPKYSTDIGLPGQARIASGATTSRYNTFSEFTNSLETNNDSSPGNTRAASTNMPFYRAYQLDSEQARRAYRSTETSADQAYRARLAQRNALYFQAMNTVDPKKRADLLRQVDRMTQVDAVDRSRPSNAASAIAGNRSAQAANRTLPPPPTRSSSTPAPSRTTAPVSRPATLTPPPTRSAPVGVAPTPAATLPTSPAPKPAQSTNPVSVPVPPPG